MLRFLIAVGCAVGCAGLERRLPYHDTDPNAAAGSVSPCEQLLKSKSDFGWTGKTGVVSTDPSPDAPGAPQAPDFTHGVGYQANQVHYRSHLNNVTDKLLSEQPAATLGPARARVGQATANPNAPCPSQKKDFSEWTGKTGMLSSDKVDPPKAKVATQEFTAGVGYQANKAHLASLPDIPKPTAIAVRTPEGASQSKASQSKASNGAQTRFRAVHGASQKNKKSPCPTPGCGQFDPISGEHQSAALEDKQKVMAETAQQVAGRPGAMPYTLMSAPYPAGGMHAKDKKVHHATAGNHKEAQQLHAKLPAPRTTGLFLQIRGASQKNKKSPCPTPGCGQFDPISGEHQSAALEDKQKVMAETAQQVAGRPGAMPYTLMSAPYPAGGMHAKDKGHHKGAQQLHAKEH